MSKGEVDGAVGAKRGAIMAGIGTQGHGPDRDNKADPIGLAAR